MSTSIKPEDLRTLQLLREAWDDIEKGRYKSMTPKNFFKELDKW